MATDDKPKSGSKPVFKDGDVAVFLNTRNITKGEKAGTSFEVFTYVKGEGPGAVRVDVPARVAGYDLQNSNANGNRFSDVADLVERGEILVTAQSAKEGHKSYPLILAALPVVEKHNDADPAKPFRSLPVVAAFPEYAKDAKNDDGSIKSGAKPRAFVIESRTGDGKSQLSEKKNLKCYRTVRAGNGEIRLTVADAVAARDALADKKAFTFERDGFNVTLSGIEAVEKVPGQSLMKWKTERVAGNSAPLPNQQSARASRALA